MTKSSKRKNGKKETQFKFGFFGFGFILTIFVLNNILLIYNIFSLSSIENLLRYICILIISLLSLFIVGKSYFNIKKNKSVVRLSLISMLIIIGFGFVNYNLIKVYNTMDNITSTYKNYSVVLVTKNSNEVNSVKDIDDDIGVINGDVNKEEYELAYDILKDNKVKQELLIYDSYEEIVKDLYEDKISYAILPENFSLMFSQIEEYADIESELKVIYKDSKKVSVASVSKKIDKPFTVLLTGVDTLESTYNADTLLLITFNPDTLSATMLSIPRDTYTKIACTSSKHKINSSGWYSDDCVIDTVSNFAGVEVDYFVKINFTGIVELVDSLGGIDVDVVYPFCEQNSKREFGDKMIYVEEGLQHLDGEQALALSRNRHYWTQYCPSKYTTKGYYSTNLRNDLTRGLNQQLVLKGILNAIGEIDDLNTIYSILDTIGNNTSTNMDRNTLLSFYNVFKDVIISTNSDSVDRAFNLQRLSLEVNSTSINIGGINLSMIIPYESSLEAVQDAMMENLGLKEKEVIKTLTFDINEEYEEKVVGKGLYDNTSVSLLKSLVGDTYRSAVTYCNKYSLNCVFEYSEVDDSMYEDGEIISQNYPANYDLSSLKNKKLVLTVAQRTAVSTFSYSSCKEQDFADDDRCIIPDFTGKSKAKFSDWYSNFGYLKVKFVEVQDSSKSEGTIISQSIYDKSIYSVYSNSSTIIVKYVKNETNDDKESDTSGNYNDNLEIEGEDDTIDDSSGETATGDSNGKNEEN